jgi:hypothetical protein
MQRKSLCAPVQRPEQHFLQDINKNMAHEEEAGECFKFEAYLCSIFFI